MLLIILLLFYSVNGAAFILFEASIEGSRNISFLLWYFENIHSDYELNLAFGDPLGSLNNHRSYQLRWFYSTTGRV